tara:strand:+ start:2352 stop:2576 length:225 start_codon:yes stop_codon:yes gene_type:complete
MKLITIALALLAFAGCAASISPVPGVEVGFDARPEMVGVSADVDPKAAGCEFAKATSWNWLENTLCVEEVPAAE